MLMKTITFSELMNKIDGSQFSVLLGAGCSMTGGIPGAREIVDDLRSGGEYSEKLTCMLEGGYFEAMQALSSRERRNIFRKYIGHSSVNVTHLIAAQLLYGGYIKAILTTNFDNLIPKAAALNIDSIPIYDATMADLHSDVDVYFPSVVYLHGQVHGFWQLNTGSELEKYRETIRVFLQRVLSDSPLIIIGYSGNDHVLEILGELKSFDHGLFWVPFNGELLSDRIIKHIGGCANTFVVSDRFNSDQFFFALAKHFKTAERYNNGIFDGFLEKLSKVRSSVCVDGENVDIIRKSKNKVSLAREFHEDLAGRITRSARPLKGGAVIDDIYTHISSFDSSIQAIVDVLVGEKPDNFMMLAKAYRDLARALRVSQLFEISTKWAKLVPGHDSYEAQHLIATNMCEAGKLGRDKELLISAEPYLKRAISGAKDCVERGKALNSLGVSRQDIANIIIEEDPGNVVDAELYFSRAREAFTKALGENPKDPKLLNNLSSLSIDSYKIRDSLGLEEAIRYAEAAEQIRYGQGSYNLACCYALQRDKKLMLFWINVAIQARMHRASQFKSDPDFRDFWSDAEFLAAIEQA